MIPRKINYFLVEQDTAPDLPVRFLGLDLSDYTTIRMMVEKDDGTKFNRDLTPSGTDPELGFVTWQAGDLTIGTHQAEFEFIRPDTKRFTLPRRYTVSLIVRRDRG